RRRGARHCPHRRELRRIGRDHRGRHAGRRGLWPADRRAQPRGCHRLLRRRRAACDGRGLRVRDAGGHGPRPRRHLRVSRPLLSSMSPADELEVKARVDDPDGLRAALVRAGASLDFRGDMIDRRFDQGGSLAQRNEVLRLREFRAADGTPAYGVLGWKGPPSLRGLYRHRAEAEARVATPDSVVTILEQLGFTVSLRIDRRVEVYRLGHAVLRLEWYPAMDVLLEVEGEPLATRVMELGGEARAAAAREDRDRVLDAVSRRGWLAAWEGAVRRAGERVAAALDGAVERAARRVRMPRRRRRRLLLAGSEKRAIAARLAAGGEALVAALDILDAVAARVRDASVLDKAAHADWQEALRTAARRLEAAWLALETQVAEEQRDREGTRP